VRPEASDGHAAGRAERVVEEVLVQDEEEMSREHVKVQEKDAAGPLQPERPTVRT
jgi:hypothetical protein